MKKWSPERYYPSMPENENYLQISAFIDDPEFEDYGKFKRGDIRISVSDEEQEWLSLISLCDLSAGLASLMVYCKDGKVYFDKNDAHDNSPITENISKLQDTIQEGLDKLDKDKKELTKMAETDKPDNGAKGYMRDWSGNIYFKKEGRTYQRLSSSAKSDVTDKIDTIQLFAETVYEIYDNERSKLQKLFLNLRNKRATKNKEKRQRNLNRR